uniref:Uncharacterized protein n=1 Tax=Knipowitschia caucasica TaxID=637954 RepID=A0AAV2MM27_KNICA
MYSLQNSPSSSLIHLCPCVVRYFQAGLCKSLKDATEGTTIEMTSMDQDTSPFRSLRPHSQLSVTGGSLSKPPAPVVCSVAPHLPSRPPSVSDNGSIRKNRWDQDYEVRSPLWKAEVVQMDDLSPCKRPRPITRALGLAPPPPSGLLPSPRRRRHGNGVM